MRILTIAFAILCLVSCKPETQYTIEGSITGADGDGWVYLHKLWTEVPSADSVQIVNGKFHFSGMVQQAELCAISIPSLSPDVCTFILEAEEIQLRFDTADPYNDGSKVRGGHLNDEFNREQRYQEENFYNVVRRMFAEQEPVDESQKQAFKDKIIELKRTNSSYVSKYIQEHAHSPVSMYLMVWWYYQKPLDELNEVLSVFSPKLRNQVPANFMTSQKLPPSRSLSSSYQ